MPRLIQELQFKEDKRNLETKSDRFNNIENNISDHINNIFSLYLYWYVELQCVAYFANRLNERKIMLAKTAFAWS
jgi:hypothetical protein